MADRIAVMARGSIEQVSSPTEIYDRPKTLFVNQFVGTANVVAGEFVSADHGVATTIASTSLRFGLNAAWVSEP